MGWIHPGSIWKQKSGSRAILFDLSAIFPRISELKFKPQYYHVDSGSHFVYHVDMKRHVGLLLMTLISSISLMIASACVGEIPAPYSFTDTVLIPTLTPDPHLAIKSFVLSEACPNLCWRGINPGKTSKDEGINLVTDLHAEQFRYQGFLLGHQDVQWDDGGYGVAVRLYFENDTIQMLEFVGTEISDLGQYIDLLGEPGIIATGLSFGIDVPLTSYAVYFPQSRVVLESLFESGAGPNIGDRIIKVVLNGSFEEYLSVNYPNYLPYNKIQAWLGYGPQPGYQLAP